MLDLSARFSNRHQLRVLAIEGMELSETGVPEIEETTFVFPEGYG